jgi:hypothetical protein
MIKILKFLRLIKSKFDYLFFHYLIRHLNIILPNNKHPINKNENEKSFKIISSNKEIKISLHSWATSIINPELILYHQEVFEKLNLPINYTCSDYKGHGKWMESILKSSTSEVVIFFDIDCIPLNREIVLEAAKYSNDNVSIFGIAQVSNHIPPGDFIFCGASFLAISLEAWKNVGSPPLREFPGYDVGEYLSYLIIKNNKKYISLLPEYYHEFSGGYLHCFGEYGIGTYYEGGIFHLWQSRNGKYLNYFFSACNNILNNTQLDTKNLIRSRRQFKLN